MYTKERVSVDEKEKITYLLAQKMDCLRSVLQLNDATVIIGEENDVDEYVNLIEKRSVLFSELKDIDIQLQQYDLEDFLDQEQIRNWKKQMKALVEEIIRFDMNFNQFVEKIYFNLKDKLREISKEKNLSQVSSAYTTVVDFEYGQYYDKKN